MAWRRWRFHGFFFFGIDVRAVGDGIFWLDRALEGFGEREDSDHGDAPIQPARLQPTIATMDGMG